MTNKLKYAINKYQTYKNKKSWEKKNKQLKCNLIKTSEVTTGNKRITIILDRSMSSKDIYESLIKYKQKNNIIKYNKVTHTSYGTVISIIY